MDGNTDAKLVFDFHAFCGLEESTGVTMNVLDEDGAERLWLLQAVMDWSSRPDPEPTTLEAVGN